MMVGHQGRWYLAIWKAPVWITDYYSYLCSAGRAMDAATNIKQRYETNNKRTTPDIGVQSDKSALLRLRPLHLSLARYFVFLAKPSPSLFHTSFCINDLKWLFIANIGTKTLRSWMDICRMFADICMYRKKNVTVASTGRRADICTRNGSLFQS